MSISVTVKGQRELDAKFKKLDGATQDKIMRDALKDGAKLVRNDARKRIRSKTGKLKRSIKVFIPSKTKNGMSVDIGTTLFYARMIELGHNVSVVRRYRIEGRRRIAREVTVIGHSPGRPFLTPAIDSRKDEILGAIIFKVKQHIMKVVR